MFGFGKEAEERASNMYAHICMHSMTSLIPALDTNPKLAELAKRSRNDHLTFDQIWDLVICASISEYALAALYKDLNQNRSKFDKVAMRFYKKMTDKMTDYAVVLTHLQDFLARQSHPINPFDIVQSSQLSAVWAFSHLTESEPDLDDEESIKTIELLSTVVIVGCETM